MKTISNFYDNTTGLVLILLLVAGFVFGGLLAYTPAESGEHAPDPGHDTAGDDRVAAGNPPTTTTVPPTSEALENEEAENLTVIEPPAHTVSYTLVLSDTTGFAGGPALAPDGTAYVLSLGGTLTRLSSQDEPLWQLPLPDKGAGTPVLTEDRVLVLDRLGLNALTPDGDRIWRFEHEAGSAVDGPVVGPQGVIYYTVQAGSRGAVQAVHPDGTYLWQTPVATFSFFRPPQLSADGSLLFFKSEVFRTSDGSPINLQLDFEPAAILSGQDGHLYMLLESTLARWSLLGGRAVLSEERFVSSFGVPQNAGILPDGRAWMQYLSFAVWFHPTGDFLRMAETEEAFLTVLAGVQTDGTVVACGRDRSDFRFDAHPACGAFSPDYTLALWYLSMQDEALQEFAGAALTPNGLLAATEEGRLYRIVYEEQQE